VQGDYLNSFPPISGRNTKSFAHFTIRERIPAILDKLMMEHQHDAGILKQFNALRSNILHGKIEHLPHEGPDLTDWTAYLEPYLGMTWFEAPFYFVEAYFYRMILDIVHYFEHLNDPFFKQKQAELQSNLDKFDALVLEAVRQKDQSKPSFLDKLLRINLWGNKADLSQLNLNQEAHDDRQTLIDDAKLFLDQVTRGISRIDVVLDNSGMELLTDLLLIKWLLDQGLVQNAVLHTKAYPTFVSDATNDDVFILLSFLRDQGSDFSIDFVDSLQQFINEGKIKMVSDRFWNAPLHFFEMPINISADSSGSDLIIFKGDANYRRIFGDRQLPMDSSARELSGYLPAPSLAIRILKSEIIVGMTLDRTSELQVSDPDWQVNGKYGVIQYLR
jgi:hypothetical protein